MGEIKLRIFVKEGASDNAIAIKDATAKDIKSAVLSLNLMKGKLVKLTKEGQRR